MRAELARRLEALADGIRPLGRVVVAYSGGVDSTLVLEVAHRAVGSGCVGVIAKSPSLPAAELTQAMSLARDRGIAVRVLDTRELELEGYVANQPDRCYFCKSELYAGLQEAAREEGAAAILDGFNRDDRGDWRPGRRAAKEWSVISPLDRAGFGKDEIREAARGLGLPNWDKPAAACLASRVAYGTPVTLETLQRVESAEAVLKAEGFRQLRVRDRAAAASIEVELEELPRLLQPQRRARIETRLRELGYQSIAVDERGYRRGSLNAGLRPAPVAE